MPRHQLHTTIDIAASPTEVWSVLTDLASYSSWNPFIVDSKVIDGGSPRVGARLVNRMQPPGGRAITFKPTVTELRDAEAFEWLGRLVIPGLFDGRHRFELHAIDGGTRLVHTESFSGILVPLFRRSLDRDTLAGFEAFNQALKARAEASTTSRN